MLNCVDETRTQPNTILIEEQIKVPSPHNLKKTYKISNISSLFGSYYSSVVPISERFSDLFALYYGNGPYFNLNNIELSVCMKWINLNLNTFFSVPQFPSFGNSKLELIISMHFWVKSLPMLEWFDFVITKEGEKNRTKNSKTNVQMIKTRRERLWRKKSGLCFLLKRKCVALFWLLFVYNQQVNRTFDT